MNIQEQQAQGVNLSRVESIRQQLQDLEEDEVLLEEIKRRMLELHFPAEVTEQFCSSANELHPFVRVIFDILVMDLSNDQYSDPNESADSLASIIRAQPWWPLAASTIEFVVFFQLYFQNYDGCTPGADRVLNVLRNNLVEVSVHNSQ